MKTPITKKSIQPILGILLSLPCLVGGSLSAAEITQKKPNILLILADDLGYSDLGCYGGEIHTPTLDALAKDGLRFTQFYNGARCCPSRASLLSGLYAHQVDVGEFTGGNSKQPGYRGTLNNRCVTLAEALKQAGYQTFMSGKWHVGEKLLPTTRGFDRFYGFYSGYAINSWDPNSMGLFPSGPMRSYPPGTFYATDAITDYALDFIEAGRRTPDHPWFVYAAYQAPHFPLMAPKAEVDPYLDVYRKGWDAIRNARLERMKKLGLLDNATSLTPRGPIPRPQVAARDGLNGPTNPAWDSIPADRREDLARRMAIFAAMVEHMDRDIGRIIDDLRTHNELDNTLIMFLSDNGACAEWAPYGLDLNMGPPPNGDGTKGNGHGIGEGTAGAKAILHTGAELDMMGQPGGSGSAYGSGWANACNTPFRMYKHYDHEGGISTPFIVHWPARISDKGAFRTQVGHLIDIMPTLVAASGATYPDKFNGNAILPMEGKSLLPAFANQPIPREALFWEHERNQAVRVGDMKLVRLAGKPWELYDMSKDRVELNNLSASRPEMVKKLGALWDAWAARCNVIMQKNGQKKNKNLSTVDAAD